MKICLPRTTLLPLIAGLAALGSLSARPFALEENTWDNPAFVQWFTGTYAVDGQISPQINAEEQNLFKEVAPDMEANPPAAIAAIEAYLDSVQADPEAEDPSPALHYTLGSLYLQSGDIDTAIRKYKEAVEGFPTFQRAYQNLGLAHVQAGDFDEALPFLTRAVELGATGGTVWGLIGYASLNTGQPTRALTAYDQALVFQPDSKDWRLGKLNALLDADKRDLAIALLRELLRENPSDTDLWLQQANAYLGQGESMEAAINLEWVARKGGGSGQSLLLLGDIYLNEGLTELALNAYEAVLDSGESKPERLLSVVDNLSARGATTQARGFLERLDTAIGEELSEELSLRKLNLEAQLALADGEPDAAAATLEEIIRRDPLNGSALVSLGDYYRDNGEWEQAVLQYERALEVESVRIRALHALARLHVARKQFKEALRYLEEAQRVEPREYVADYIGQLRQVVRSR